MTRDLKSNLAWAGGIVLLALAASAARHMGYIDQETTTRIVITATGLMIVWQGNRIPKAFTASPVARQCQRVAAWSLVLSGLVYAGLWAFAPMDVAIWGGCGAVLAGMVVTFGYCLLRTRARAA